MASPTLQLQRTNHDHDNHQPNHYPEAEPLHRLIMPLQQLSSSAAQHPALIHLMDPISQQHHTHAVGPSQCCSAVVQTISAPLSTVWSKVRRFDNPQAYKHFLKSCQVIMGQGDQVGSLREVHVVSGLPAASSRERLDILDDERHVMSFSVVGGDHRLTNYKSVTTVHNDNFNTTTKKTRTTVVVESYVVDIPTGNTWEDTCAFVDTIVKCNLRSLAQIAQDSAKIS